MVDEGTIEDVGPQVRRAGYRVTLSADQQRRVDTFLSQIELGGFQPPTPVEAGIDPDLVRAMSTLGMIVVIGDGIVFTPARLQEAEQRLVAALRASESISLAEYRDQIGATRKYTQAILEYFDRQRVTRRVGDRRVGVRPALRIEDKAST